VRAEAIHTNGVPSFVGRGLLTFLLISAIFVFDLMIPLGVAVGVLYIIPLLIALSGSSRTWCLAVAGICTALIAAGAVLSTPQAPFWLILSNRFLSTLTLWVTLVLAVQYKMAQAQVASLQQLLPVCASCKSLRSHNGSWKPVDRYVESLSQAVLSESICPQCVEKWYPELYPEVTERYPTLSKPA
jgi:hypothetical protein